LVCNWVAALRDGKVIHPFSDMVMAPVSLESVVEVLAGLGDRWLPGVVQVSGAEDVIYEEAARYVAGRLGAAASLVQPIKARSSGIPFESIPAHTTLDTGRLTAETGWRAPHLADTFCFLNEERSS
jgi:dTDP-4-dehydrorhamnose reductase